MRSRCGHQSAQSIDVEALQLRGHAHPAASLPCSVTPQDATTQTTGLTSPDTAAGVHSNHGKFSQNIFLHRDQNGGFRRSRKLVLDTNVVTIFPKGLEI